MGRDTVRKSINARVHTETRIPDLRSPGESRRWEVLRVLSIFARRNKLGEEEHA